MSEILIFTPFDRFLWVIAICICVIGGYKYFSRGHRSENKAERIMVFAFGGFFISFALNLIFLYICDYISKGRYFGNDYYAKMNTFLVYGGLYNTVPLFSTFYFLALYSWFSGVLILVIMFEKVHQEFLYIEDPKKPKYIFTITIIIAMGIAAINFELAHILFMIDVWLIVVTLFWLSTKASKELQAVSIFIIIGTNLSFFAAQIRATMHILNLSPILPPILMIIGLLSIVSPLFIDLNKILQKKPLFHWKVLIIVLSVLTVSSIYLILTPELPLYLKLYYSFQNVAVFGFLVIFGIFQKHKKEKEYEAHRTRHNLTENEEIKYLFRGFMKPKQLTEEEVTVAKENRICLVCKNRLERKMYICPKCNTFYCNKCSDTLSNLENACWVCDTPFDETKSIKREKEEEKFELDAEEPKLISAKK